MWWKASLLAAVSFVLGMLVTVGVMWSYWAAATDIREHYLPEQWSSAGKEWLGYADWLRHGGRRLLQDAAFSAMKDGMSETEVRRILGPPDMVVVGDEEFQPYQVANMKGLGAAGAYLYKIGRFASGRDQILNEVFEVVFDSTGRTRYRLGFATKNADKLADLDTDTRSERRISH
jgi:hypothetical protein